jgi:hypothetical protein
VEGVSLARITLSRAKGWKLPPNTIVVARGPGRIFGNPFTVAAAKEAGCRDPQRAVVDAFRDWLAGNFWACGEDRYEEQRAAILDRLPELRGKNLACWCKPGTPCHADVLIELANGGAG